MMHRADDAVGGLRPRDYVAIVLAVCAGISVIALTIAGIIAGLDDEGDISTAYASLLTGTLGVLIGALSGYIGGRHGDQDPPTVIEQNRPDDRPTDGGMTHE